jgi:hypothetical protein
MGTQRSCLMLGSAVSSSNPNDFQPNSQKGSPNDPQITLRAISAPPAMAYIAVGTKRALAASIGLPRRSTSALWMLVLLIPAEVRRSFIVSFFGLTDTFSSGPFIEEYDGKNNAKRMTYVSILSILLKMLCGIKQFLRFKLVI